MYPWIVNLQVIVLFLVSIPNAGAIFLTYKLRERKEPAGIYAGYSFMVDQNTRNLRITFSLIIVTGMIAGFISPWWRQGWMWTALGVMILLWILMRRIGSRYLTAVDAIAEAALKNKDNPSNTKFRSVLKARREPELLSAISVIGGLIIMWLMMFKPF